MGKKLLTIIAALFFGNINVFSENDEAAKYVIYDEQHRVKEEIFTNFKTEYRYEENLTIKTSNIITPDTTTTVYTYDKDGKKLKVETYEGACHDAVSVERFFYHGDVLDSSVVFSEDNNRECLKLYDSKGLMIREIYGKYSQSDYKYDEKGNLVESKSDHIIAKCTYDEKNRMISAVATRRSLEIQEYAKTVEVVDSTIKDIEDDKTPTTKRNDEKSRSTVVDCSIKDIEDGWISTIGRNDEDFLSYEKVKTDEKGNIVQKIFTSHQFVTRTETNEYDQQGRKTQTVVIEWPWKSVGIDLPNYEIKREYIDEAGKVVKVEYFNQLMQPTTQCDNYYDSGGKLVKKVWYDRHHNMLTISEY